MHCLLKLSSSANPDGPKLLGIQTVKKQCSGCRNDTLDSLVAKPLMRGSLSLYVEQNMLLPRPTM